MGSGSKASVTRRRVFYIPGYDPIHPRRYRELYRSEGAEQAAISGYQMSLTGRSTKGGNYGWTVNSAIDGHAVETEFEVLVWSDIVRESMETGVFGTYRQLFSTAWRYIGSGTLRRLMRLRAGPVIAALYPIVFLLLQLVLAAVLTVLVGWLLSSFSPWLAILALGIFPAVIWWFRKNDNKFYAYYLMHDYAYSARSGGAVPPDLEMRIAEFANTISDAMASDVDEVLVVGHSSGAHLGVSILSDYLRGSKSANDGPSLSFLTLGHVVPMVAFLPDAWRLRGDLAFLGSQTGLAWVDVSAPADGCAFALCHPVKVTGVGQDTTVAPLVISAAFSQTLSAEKWASLRRRYFRIHFQYLCAFDRPRDYDYFQITAGPHTLGDRFHGRAPSPSVIDRPTSKYRSITP